MARKQYSQGFSLSLKSIILVGKNCKISENRSQNTVFNLKNINKTFKLEKNIYIIIYNVLNRDFDIWTDNIY